MLACLALSIKRYGSRVKWSNPGNGAAPSQHFGAVAIENGAYWSSSTKVTNFTFYLLLQIFKTMEKSEFRVLIKHCILMEKIQSQQSSGLISVIWTLFRRKTWLRGGILILNVVGQTQIMLNDQVAQIRQLSGKTQKNFTNSFWPIVNLNFCEVEELKISKWSVFIVLLEYLSRRKLCSKWVSHLLAID